MIFHIFGGECSGRTSAVKQLNTVEFLHWDIVEDFYKPTGCIVDGKMDWKVFRVKEKLIKSMIEKVVDDNKDKHIVIESTGTNATVNTVLKQYAIVPVNMGIPNAHETVTRAELCGKDINVAYDLNKLMIVKFWDLEHKLPKVLSIDSAVRFIVKKSRGEWKEE